MARDLQAHRNLTAAQAAALLGVKPATLYSYVSRGLIRSEPGQGGTRARLYHAGDVQALLGRQQARRDPEAAVQDALGGALNWGSPILDSALTRLTDGQLYYRGQSVVTLAEHSSVEEVASLLWTGDVGGWRQLPLRARLNLMAQRSTQLSTQPRASTTLEAFAYALTHAGAHDLLALDTRPESLPGQAARTVNLLYATLERVLGIPGAPDLALHARLARAWGVSGQADLLRRALILLADHELNASAFTARVAASAGSSVHHATLAALCALQGPRHGLAPLDAFDLIQLALRSGARAALRDATRRYARVPGFGHCLYPAGDVRASALLRSLLDSETPSHPVLVAAQELMHEVHAETGEHPNIDFALAVLAQVLGRPADDTVTLFALGRSVGWAAHALETLQTGQLIRPRARYVGL